MAPPVYEANDLAARLTAPKPPPVVEEDGPEEFLIPGREEEDIGETVPQLRVPERLPVHGTAHQPQLEGVGALPLRAVLDDDLPLQNAPCLRLHDAVQLVKLEILAQPFEAETLVAPVQSQDLEMSSRVGINPGSGQSWQGPDGANVPRDVADERISETLKTGQHQMANATFGDHLQLPGRRLGFGIHGFRRQREHFDGHGARVEQEIRSVSIVWFACGVEVCYRPRTRLGAGEQGEECDWSEDRDQELTLRPRHHLTCIYNLGDSEAASRTRWKRSDMVSEVEDIRGVSREDVDVILDTSRQQFLPRHQMTRAQNISTNLLHDLSREIQCSASVRHDWHETIQVRLERGTNFTCRKSPKGVDSAPSPTAPASCTPS